jgi:hypothetical protein
MKDHAFRTAGSLGSWLGGGLSRMAATGVASGVILVAFGMTPAEVAAYLWRSPPAWITNPWVGIGTVIVGLAVIGASLRFNVWSQRQRAIDTLAEDISWAISDLLNKRPDPLTDEGVEHWEVAFRGWCARVSAKLENRAFFTRADQLHFDRLGFVQPIAMSGHQRLDWLLGQLRLKLDRLREIINWAQQRPR